MPSSQEHRQKADRNRTFLSTVDPGTAPEWASVVAFYLALHLVERLAAHGNTHNAGHHDRLAYLTAHRHHRRIHRHFLALFDASNTARYATVNQFLQAYPGDTVQRVLIDIHLAAIETYVTNWFSPPPAPPAVQSGN